MHTFASSVIIAGVLIFVGGLLALGAQRAGQMGAPRWVVMTAGLSSTLSMIAAIGILVMGISALPGENDGPNTDVFIQ